MAAEVLLNLWKLVCHRLDAQGLIADRNNVAHAFTNADGEYAYV